MSAADRIRALTDSGTPGPWQAGHHLVLRTEVVPEIIASATQLGGPIDQTRNEADAAKIVAAVNALPKVAALVAAVDALPKFDPPPAQYHDPACDGTGCGCWLVGLDDAVLTARDELVAALGVDSE